MCACVCFRKERKFVENTIDSIFWHGGMSGG
jgi:hypothetical protein